MQMLLSNRVAIVTGGATGMGRSTAVRFAEEGCDVVIADIKVDEASLTLSMVKDKGRDGLAIECNVSDSAKVREVVSRTIAKFGKIDIIVNSAGGSGASGQAIQTPPGLTNITEERWERTVAVNLKGTFLFCKEVVPHMKEKKYGKIINVSSLGWMDPPVPGADYHAAKAGIVGLSNDMACELGAFGIHANVILPGPIRTPFYDFRTKSMTDSEKDAFFEAVGRITPLKRIGLPEDIAGVALFLASDLSSYVTGASIPVGGGLPLSPSATSFAGSGA
jgi:NAD(P)-dependent dehydrogenase (short-subunit alcohol dehydrogenase family)